MNRIPQKYLTVFVYLILALWPAIIFCQLRNYDFINFDDLSYVVDNQNVTGVLNLKKIEWAFTADCESNWHPLTWISHMLDCHLFGVNAGWHHLTNVFFHIANTLLLFTVLRRMTEKLWPSAFVAVLFALHPFHVESVAWIAERKDVLSTFFWMLTMAAYLRYTKTSRILWYLTTLLTFALGLMSKPMLVTLPFVLLLLDYWPLERMNFQIVKKRKKRKPPSLQNVQKSLFKLVLEKIPFFCFSAASSIITFVVQNKSGAVVSMGGLPLKIRAANTVVSYIKYIFGMFWPSHLAIFYPHPTKNLPIWQVICSVIGLLVITVLVVGFAKKHKYLAVGWFWFLGTLVPVIGLVQVGGQSMADRYTYIPLIGLFIIIAWALPDLLGTWESRLHILAVSAVVVVIAVSIVTYHQLKYWKNSTTLFEHALNITTDNWLASYSFGEALHREKKYNEAFYYQDKAIQINPNYSIGHIGFALTLNKLGRLEEAIAHLKKAISLGPKEHQAYISLGSILSDQGKYEEAIEIYNKALEIDPDSINAIKNLGNVFLKQDRLEEAISQYKLVLEKLPDSSTKGNTEVLSDLGVALARQGNTAQAITYFNKAIAIDAKYVPAYENLGRALNIQDKFDEAVEVLNVAVRLDPNNTKVLYLLAKAYSEKGDTENLIVQLEKILQIDTESTETLNQLAWIKATSEKDEFRNSKEAIKLAEHACKITNYQNPIILDTLAAAYAAAGRFDEAISTQEDALEIAGQSKQDQLYDEIQSRLELFKKHQPYIELPSKNKEEELQ